jgi:hypothetical protein
MNWEAIGAVGDALGAVAVFVTLGYLAVQVRYARQELVHATRQARSDAMRQVWLTQAAQPELADAFAKLFAAQGISLAPFATAAAAAGLSAAQARQLFASFWASWSHYEQMIESLEQLSGGARRQFDGTLRANLGPGGPASAWYATVRSRLNPDAVRYVDALLARSGSADE